jgi:hypothetical protein
MQIRKSSLTGDRPLCPVDHTHPIHYHGSYERYANCDDEIKEDILRYLCPPCGHTISVLPDHRLPYRPISVPQVEQDFDARADDTPPPPATEKEKGCLARAWHSFVGRVNVLTAVLGQMMRVVKPNATSLWKQLREQGNLRVILLRLARPFNTSLLKDYKCLRPWPPPAGS